MKKIAFICVHNSCRSQIAEALGKHLAGDVFESYSAGTETKPKINQDAVRLMKELYGIDMEESQYSKLIKDIPEVDLAISMGCNVSCPYIGRKFDANWELEDPTGKSDEEFKIIISEIEKNIQKLKEQMMNKNHIEKVTELRNAVPMCTNCNQTILVTYAKELGLSEEQAMGLGVNFGGGMKSGLVCGAITAGLMVLGMKGVDSPAHAQEFIKRMSEKHEGLINCADLLKLNIQKGGKKKPHCDAMIKEAVEIIDEMVQRETHE